MIHGSYSIKKAVEKIKTHILCSIFFFFFFRESGHLWINVEKYCRAGHATDNNMAHALFTLGAKGYRHTLRVCNIAFPRQHCLCKRFWMLGCTYFACLVTFASDWYEWPALGTCRMKCVFHALSTTLVLNIFFPLRQIRVCSKSRSMFSQKLL